MSPVTDATGGPDPEWDKELDEDYWIDPDIIRGIERITGETYRDGRWYQEPAAVDECPEGEREE